MAAAYFRKVIVKTSGPGTDPLAIASLFGILLILNIKTITGRAVDGALAASRADLAPMVPGFCAGFHYLLAVPL